MKTETQPLKLLIAEDNPDDETLLLRELRRAGYAVNHRRVDNEADYRQALKEEWDLVLSDYQMPQFTGLRALEVLQALGHAIPFIIVSGTIGEDTAVAVMRQGAADYLLKDRLTRLGPAVAQAMAQSRSHRERRQIEQDFQLLFARNPMPMWVYELENLRFVAVNDAAVEHYGYSREEFLTLGLKDIRPPEDVPRMLESVRDRPAGITHAGVWRHRKKDGSEILVDTTAQRTTFLGRPAELVMASDVTQRVASEKALRESEARLRLVTDTAQVGLVMVDADHRYRYANPAYARILQLATHELTGRRVADVLPAVYESQIRPRLERAFADERQDYELVVPAPEGGRRYAVRYEPTKVDGKVALVVVVLTDITERMRAAEALRLFRTLVDQSGDTFEVIDPATGRFIDVNQKGPAELGCSREEYLARRVCDIDPDMPEDAWPGFVGSIRQTGAAKGEGLHRRRDGTTFPIEFNAKWVRLDRDYIVTVVRDITERRHAEGIVRQASGRVVLNRRKRAWIDWAFLLVATGMVYSLAVRFNWFESVTRWLLAHDVEQMDEIILTAVFLAAGLAVLAFRRWRDSESALTSHQQMQAALGLLHEELERRVKQRTEELSGANLALQESEKRFRELAANIDEVFWITDPAKHRMLYISPGYEQIWGRPCAELYASSHAWIESIHADDRDRVLAAATTKQAAGTYDETYRILRPDGATRWIRDRAFPVKGAEGRVERIVGVAADITEQKKLQEQFLHAQRMEAIGTLASGVAHDLNNILAPMLMVAGLLKHRPGSTPRDLELLTIIEDSGQRGAGIIRQLLTFSRGMSGERGPLQPRHLVHDMARVMRETFPRNIAIIESAASDLWTVEGDATQLHQVIMNLCVNARDAMPAGGTLTIGAANISVGEGDAASLDPAAQAGPHVLLQVSDTGSGIPPEIINRIFEPFFTTKGVGKGTGLGLSTVVGIIRGHGGYVKVSSEPGRGSIFRVYLPASEGGVGHPVPAGSPAPVPGGHGEEILVVDDEAPIREATRSLLERHHYRVILAANGEEALRVFLQNQGVVRLVLTDIMMPKMDGLALIRVLRVLAPKLPIVATSGLDQGKQAGEFAGLGVTQILTKPFAPERLLKAIEDSLAS